MLVDSVNAAIQISQGSLNETFVVQVSTVTESVESSTTVPVMQCKKLKLGVKKLLINEHVIIVYHVTRICVMLLL